MEHNKEIGRIYDCIYFGIVYFYQRGFSDGVSPFENDIMTAADIGFRTNYKFYDEVSKNKPEVPKSLYPFFYYDGQDPCLLTNYFNTFLDYDNEGFDEFIETLKDEKRILKSAKKQILKDIAPERREFLLKDENENECLEEIRTLDVFQEIKKRYLYLFKNFEKVSGQLIGYFKAVYPLICRLHEEHSFLKEEAIAQLKRDKAKRILDYVKVSFPMKRKRTVFSFCLLHKHILSLQFFEKCEFFTLGLKAFENFDTTSRYAHASVRTCMALLANETRHLIMETLRKNGCLTSTQLSRLLNISISTVHEGIELLVAERMIKVLRINVREIYYVVNGEYFDVIHQRQDEFIKQYLSENLQHDKYSLKRSNCG